MPYRDTSEWWLPPVERRTTSYFSEVGGTLDPILFDGTHMRPHIRHGLLELLFGYLEDVYNSPEDWAHAWVAGSGVSFQWEAQRLPGDLDVLVGVDYVNFRRANPSFVGMSDSEISSEINEGFRRDLYPETEEWNNYEVTFYVNPGATDIRAIQPYAAYDLNHDEWTVYPSLSGAPRNPEWDAAAGRDLKMTSDIISRYGSALDRLKNSTNDAYRRNAEQALGHALGQASSLYDEIHLGRKQAFSPTGEGYSDYHNYRWQSAKSSGVVSALSKLKEYHKTSKEGDEVDTYGVTLPDTNTLIRRAALRRYGL